MPGALGKTFDSLLPVGRLSRAERVAVASMWLVGVLQGFAQSQAAATLPFVRVGLGIDEGEMSAILAVARIASFGALALSHWGDRRGRKVPFLAAYTLVITAGFGSSLVQAPWQFAIGQSLVRVGTAALTTLVVVLLAEQVDRTLRAFAISIYGAAGSLGAALALATLPLAGAGPEAWRIPFALSGLGVVALPLLVRTVRESPRSPGFVPSSAPLRELLTGPFARRFWLVAAIGMVGSAFTAVSLSFSTERLIDDVGLTVGAAVAVSLLGGTVGGLGFFVGGRLADVFGRRPVAVAALLMAAVGGVGLYWFTAIVPLVVSIVVGSFGSFSFVPAAAAHRAELFPTETRATAGTAAANLAMVGSAAGLGLGRFTIAAFGLSETVTFLAGGMAVAAILTLLLPETKGQALDGVRPDR